MKFRFGFILLAAVTLLAGCSGFWNLPPSTTTTTVTKTTLSSGVFYVLNQTTKQIAAYTISTGTLEQVSGSPYSLSSAPNCIAVASNGGFLYVGTVSGIYLYSIGSGGALTIGNGGAVISSDVASAMQVSGAWLIDAFLPAAGTVQMNAIPINATTGAYTGTGAPPDQTFNVTNASVSQMVLSPDGTNLFLALGRGGTIVVPFTAVNANPLGSKATVIATVNSNGSALSVAVDPTNRLFYIGETLANSAGDSGGLRVFNYSSLSGALTQASGSPIASGGLSPNAI